METSFQIIEICLFIKQITDKKSSFKPEEKQLIKIPHYLAICFQLTFLHIKNIFLPTINISIASQFFTQHIWNGRVIAAIIHK